MKKLIMAAMIAACIALCAAMWPQSEAIEKTPAPIPIPAVSAPEATVAELKTEVESALLSEEEKTVDSQTGEPQEATPEPEPAPMETPAALEVQPMPEPEETSEAAHEPTPEPATEPAEEQMTDTPQSANMVYVPGFGWIESQGPNQVDYTEDMYENGNKIGSMG